MYGQPRIVSLLIQKGANRRMPDYPGGSLRWADLAFMPGSAAAERHEGIRRYMQDLKDKAN